MKIMKDLFGQEVVPVNRTNTDNCKNEMTGYRDLEFNNWIRCNLASSYRLNVSDIDFVLNAFKDKNGSRINRIILVEVKIGKGDVNFPQSDLFEKLDVMCKFGSHKAGVEYYGFIRVFFTTKLCDFDHCYVSNKFNGNGARVTEKELIQILNLEYELNDEKLYYLEQNKNKDRSIV